MCEIAVFLPLVALNLHVLNYYQIHKNYEKKKSISFCKKLVKRRSKDRMHSGFWFWCKQTRDLLGRQWDPGIWPAFSTSSLVRTSSTTKESRLESSSSYSMSGGKTTLCILMKDDVGYILK